MDLICKEKVVDFDREEVEKEILEEERIKRYSAEVKIYFLLKDYINVMNRNAITHEYTLKIVASGYKQTKDEFEVVLYSADEWKRYFVDGLAKVLEEIWQAELNTTVTCDYNLVEILKNKLYVTTYRIKSDHIIESELQFFYHN